MILNTCRMIQEDIRFSCQAQIRFCHRTASYKVQRGITKINTYSRVTVVVLCKSSYGATETATYVTQKVSIQELWFLHSACRLMLVNICMKFHEDILNGFKIIERT